MSICEDIKVGGTVGTTSITGGTSISNYGLLVFDYSSLWGTVGKRASSQPAIGQPGGIITGKELPQDRIHTLAVMSTDQLPAGGGQSPQQLWDNQDVLTSLFTAAGGSPIEWILPTESRWIRAYNLIGGPTMITGKYRRLILPLTSPWPYWQSTVQQSQVINGAGVAYTIGGTVERIYNPTIVFAGDGVFTDVTSGLTMTVTGSGGAVTVERNALTGRWTALEGGVPVPGKIAVIDSRWMFLTRGGTATTTVSCTVSWRDSWE